MKMTKEQEKRRILTRILATEFTNEELKRITGGVGTNSLTSAFDNDEDDCDVRPFY